MCEQVDKEDGGGAQGNRKAWGLEEEGERRSD